MSIDIEKYRSALNLLISVWSDTSKHDGCACMGPSKGHDLCPCAQRVVVVNYMKDALKFLPPIEEM